MNTNQLANTIKEKFLLEKNLKEFNEIKKEVLPDYTSLKKEWRDIEETKGVYKLSNYGEVVCIKNNKSIPIKPIIIYNKLYVFVYADKIKMRHNLGKLIFNYFNNKMLYVHDVEFIDGDLTNCNILNLKPKQYYHKKKQITINDIESILKIYSDIIIEECENNGKLKIPSIGTFHLIDVQERKRTSPTTQEEVLVPAHKTIRFSISQSIKEKLNV